MEEKGRVHGIVYPGIERNKGLGEKRLKWTSEEESLLFKALIMSTVVFIRSFSYN